MGLLDLARGRFPAARQRLEETLQKAQSSELSEQVSVSNVHLAELALVEGRYADAMAKAEQAAQIAGRRSDRRTEIGVRLQIVRAGLSIGDTALIDTRWVPSTSASWAVNRRPRCSSRWRKPTLLAATRRKPAASSTRPDDSQPRRTADR